MSTRARALIEEPKNSIFVSTASIWEITIKHALYRARANDIGVPGTDALKYFQLSGFEILAILPEHALAVAALPSLHNDPFDRVLLAQSKVETLQLLTSDGAIGAYGEPVILV